MIRDDQPTHGPDSRCIDCQASLRVLIPTTRKAALSYGEQMMSIPKSGDFLMAFAMSGIVFGVEDNRSADRCWR